MSNLDVFNVGALIKNIPTLGNGDKDVTKEDTEEILSGVGQGATLAQRDNEDNGFFPGSFLGWLGLTFVITALIGFMIYIAYLYEQIKVLQKQQSNQNGNGNFANGLTR